MAHAGPSQPEPTESIDIAELKEEIDQFYDNSLDFCQTTLSIFETLSLEIALMELTKRQMEERFDTRCRHLEAKQCKILATLEELSNAPSKGTSIPSTPSNVLKQLLASPLHHGEKQSAAPKMMTQARMTTFVNGPTRLLPTMNYIPFFTKLHTLHTILKTHWQASRQLDSMMTVAYPWLSFAMASCYYLALGAWLCDSASVLYQWCTMDLGHNRSVSTLILEVGFGFVDRFVPYTLGSGNPFATLVVLLLWMVLVLRL